MGQYYRLVMPEANKYGEVRLLNNMDEVVETYTAESPNLPSELKKYGLEKGQKSW